MTIPWPLVRDELDRAPPASLVEPLTLAPTDAIGEAPFPTFSGVGPGSHTVDRSAGVYVASVFGDTTELNVTMQTLDGRSITNWGRVPYASFAVGAQVEASLYPGRTLRARATGRRSAQRSPTTGGCRRSCWCGRETRARRA